MVGNHGRSICLQSACILNWFAVGSSPNLVGVRKEIPYKKRRRQQQRQNIVRIKIEQMLRGSGRLLAVIHHGW